MRFGGLRGVDRSPLLKQACVGADQPARDRFGPRSASSRAFTLIELMVVIGVIAVLASMLLPVLHKSKQKGQGTLCLNNLRQLILGWTMYAHEYDDWLAPNSDGERAGKDRDRPSWVAGWLRTDLESGGKYDSTNVALLVGKQYAGTGSIGPYVGEAKIYRCPADKSRVTIEGATYNRVRSMSMNAYMNGNGVWQSPDYVTFQKLSGIQRPSDMWVLLDEREDSINDGYFATDMTRNYAIVDYPASYHNGSCGFSFADAHSEYRRWQEPTTTPILKPGEHLPLGSKYTTWNDRDMAWLTQRTTVHK